MLLRRHERPVLGEAVSIVHLDDDLVVVHKPPSVPVSLSHILFIFPNTSFYLPPTSLSRFFFDDEWFSHPLEGV